MLSPKVTSTIDRYVMVRPGERILVGLSGGADSVALTEILVDLKPSLEISLVLAHLNHGLRRGADDDEAFCREVADRHSLPFVT
ncbi:MAG: ATP-binding protein, partial [Vicinamibacteria bacterium]